MNNYEHVICLEDATKADVSLYKPRASHDGLEAKQGDVWRWLAPKSIANDIDERLLAVALVKPKYRAVCSDPFEDNVIRYELGSVRKQESENYVQLSFWVGAPPDGVTWRQFALQRKNGQTVVGTFKGQQTNKVDYMNAIKSFYESFPYTKILCDVDGSKVTLRIWEKDGVFKLADEGLMVGLGSSGTSNTNSPKIDRLPQANYTYPMQDRYTLGIGENVQEGNVFTLDSVIYIAAAGDNADTVKAQFVNSNYYFVGSGAGITATATAGVRVINNSNTLSVQAVFNSVSGGLDRYLVKVIGALQPGNVVQVSATGKTTKSYQVKVGDTVTTIENYFNSDSGYYAVSTGIIPVTTYLAGIQSIPNTNTPSITLSDYTAIASYTVKRWQIIIGSDIKSGNVFRLLDQEYTAKDGDTSLLIANVFGYDSVSFQIETDVLEDPTAYALKGFAYDVDNVANVTISEQPKLAISSQYVCEASFGCEIESGEYRLAIIDKSGEVPTVLRLGNYVNVRPNAKGELVEVSDDGDVFGYEYFEMGLTQRLRLPVFIAPPKQSIEEERQTLFNGGYNRTTTKIEYNSTLITRAGYLPLHVTIASFLKHKYLRIAEKLFYVQGEYIEEETSVNSEQRQGKAQITQTNREKNNYSKYRSTYYQSGEYGGFVRLRVCERLRAWLEGVSIVTQIVNDKLVNTGSYRLTGEVFDDLNINVYEDGTLRLTATVAKNTRFRLTEYFKMKTGSIWTIKTELSGACASIPTITYRCDTVGEIEIVRVCEVIEKTAIGEFTDDYDYDFS